MKKTVILLTALIMLAGNTFAGGTQEQTSTEDTDLAGVSIQLVNTKGEIQAQLEDIAVTFEKDTGIHLEILGVSAGVSPFEKILSLYASGNAPALYMGDAQDMPKPEEKLLDLSGEKWISDTGDGMLSGVTTNTGTVLAFPLTVEGFGFIYNKDILDTAGVDPDSIHTINALDEAFSKIEATGKGALLIAPMDWSLAAHFLGIGYTVQTGRINGADGLFELLKAGEISVADNDGVKGILNVFDVMIKHNTEKNDPLAPNYEKGPELLGLREIGFWFMGNWAWPQIESFSEGEGNFGFIPVPVSNDPKRLGNNEISVSPSKYIAVDKTQNNERQQKAALEFLNWLVYFQSGLDALVNGCSIIPAFTNIKLQPSDPLAKDIKRYIGEGKTIPFVLTSLQDHWSIVGAFMQKYLAGQMSRNELYTAIDGYWTEQE